MEYEVTKYITKLDKLFKMAEDIDDDDELQAHMARYLCIRTSGLIEVYMKSQINAYCSRSCPKEVVKFVNSHFKTFTNIDTDKLTKFFERFSTDWLEKFNDGMTEEMSSHLNAVISNRNNIAHGHNDSISLVPMQKYYTSVKNVINLLDTIIKH